MKIFHMVLGPIRTNVYLIVNEQTNACLIVDPGDEGERIREAVDSRGLHPEAILLTHGHFDHIMAGPALKEAYQIPVLAMEAERPLLSSAMTNLSSFHDCAITFGADRYLSDGEKLTLAGLTFQAIHTPGHTAGGACYYFPEEKVLFAGDTLFHESVGRSDLPSGDGETLVRSIKEKLLALPDDVEVYTGHGVATSIGHERLYNIFIQ